MVCSAGDASTAGAAMPSEFDERTVSIPGVLASCAWVVGLAIGLVALTLGHELVAALALGLAIMAPWFGLAWVEYSQRRASEARQCLPEQAMPYADGWSALQVTNP